MVFIGLKVVRLDPDAPVAASWKYAKVVHFNPSYIKYVDEKEMIIMLDDNSKFRCDEESIQIFLVAMYGDENLLNDKLRD